MADQPIDTTDQQAVTVAQIDRDAVQAFHRTMLDRLMSDVKSQRPKLGDDEGDAGTLVQAFARHRLASVSSASAETADYRALLIQAGRNSGAFISDSASDEFLELIPEEVRLKVERLAASPEPVPATNQAGEVEEATFNGIPISGLAAGGQYHPGDDA